MKNGYYEVLNKYFNVEDIDKLLNELTSGQRANIINDKYFAKIGKNSDLQFFNKMKKELAIYLNNQGNISLPKLIDYYLDDEICLIILKKIDGKVIGKYRNHFNTHIGLKKRLFIAQAVLNIGNMHVNGIIEDNYNRKEKLEKYFEKAKTYLPEKVIKIIYREKDRIAKEKYDGVLSHGDLISTNIIIKKDVVYFIDWEYISIRPKYYDLIYFLLFSKTNRSIDILYSLESIDIEEALKDGVIICLKEICNNAKLYGLVNESIVNKNIDRWIRELKRILKFFTQK